MQPSDDGRGNDDDSTPEDPSGATKQGARQTFNLWVPMTPIQKYKTT